MNKRIICILLCVIFAFSLIGCGTVYDRVDEKAQKPASMFVIIEKGVLSNYYIVYHRDTKVMYAVSNGGYNVGNFTVLLNPDGSPMLWKGD